MHVVHKCTITMSVLHTKCMLVTLFAFSLLMRVFYNIWCRQNIQFIYYFNYSSAAFISKSVVLIRHDWVCVKWRELQRNTEKTNTVCNIDMNRIKQQQQQQCSTIICSISKQTDKQTQTAQIISLILNICHAMHCNVSRAHHSQSQLDIFVCAHRSQPTIMSSSLASFDHFYMRTIQAPHAVWISAYFILPFSLFECHREKECFTANNNFSFEWFATILWMPDCWFFSNLHAFHFGITARYFSYSSVCIICQYTRLKLILCWLIFVSYPFFFCFSTHTWTHLLIHLCTETGPDSYFICTNCCCFYFTAAQKRPNNIRVCYLIFQQSMSTFVTKHLIYFVDFVFFFS